MTNNICKKGVIYNRLDLVAGIDYVESYEKKWKTDFFRSVHLTIKECWNNLIEHNHTGAEAFVERFNNLIEGIKKEYI